MSGLPGRRSRSGAQPRTDAADAQARPAAEIGGIERGQRNPFWENVVKLARGLGVNVSELAARPEQLAR